MPVPQRTCLGCRQVDDQQALARFVLVEGKVQFDSGRDAPGRGAWLHPSRSCLEEALRRRGFARSFRQPADPSALAASGWPDEGHKG